MNARDLRAKGKEMKKLTLAAIVSAVSVGALADAWTTFNLPTATDSYSWGLAHTSDGRFVYANQGTFWRQNSLGSGAVTQFANSPGATTAPSFIAAGSGSTAVAGVGGWGASALQTFSVNSSSSSFTSSTFTLQNFSGRMRDENSVYVGGGNGAGGSHSLSYVALDGSANKVLIDQISDYSCGFAMDASGNLFVGDNDDGKVYFFSKLQLDGAIAGSSLTVGDGTEVADFGAGGKIGSLAVDANGVLWAAGWQESGITSYDQGTGSYYNWTPGFDSTSYIVDTFSDGANDYVAFVSNTGTGNGSDVVYGYADVAAVPEPSSVILLVGGFGGLVWFRRRRKYFFKG